MADGIDIDITDRGDTGRAEAPRDISQPLQKIADELGVLASLEKKATTFPSFGDRGAGDQAAQQRGTERALRAAIPRRGAGREAGRTSLSQIQRLLGDLARALSGGVLDFVSEFAESARIARTGLTARALGLPQMGVIGTFRSPMLRQAGLGPSDSDLQKQFPGHFFMQQQLRRLTTGSSRAAEGMSNVIRESVRDAETLWQAFENLRKVALPQLLSEPLKAAGQRASVTVETLRGMLGNLFSRGMTEAVEAGAFRFPTRQREAPPERPVEAPPGFDATGAGTVSSERGLDRIREALGTIQPGSDPIRIEETSQPLVVAGESSEALKNMQDHRGAYPDYDDFMKSSRPEMSNPIGGEYWPSYDRLIH